MFKSIQIKTPYHAFFAMIICLVFSATGLIAQDDVEALEEQAIRKAVDSVAASLVRFETIGGTSRVEGAVVAVGPSTGVIVSKDGFAISASFNFAHQPATIFARLPNGKRASAEIMGRDLSRKLVLLKIQSDFEFEVPVSANSESVQVGETVIAVGRVIDPDSPSLSTGIVSAKNRIWDRATQTDAKISPANFGGPLLNLKGEVVGILVPMSPDDESEMAGTDWYDSGIGFAVPFDHVLSKIDQLKRGQTLRKGLIGVSLEGSNDIADPAVVAFCRGSSPAGKAGIKPGDEIVQVGNRPIARQSEMKHALGPLYEDEVVNVVVNRDGQQLAFDVKLAGEIEPFVPTGIGLLTGSANESELTVVHVMGNGAAAKAGIKVGDRIENFGGEPVESRESLRLAIASADVGSQVEMTVRRNGQAEPVQLTIGKRRSTIPTELPRSFAAVGADAVEVMIADAANKCYAIVPESKVIATAPALLVWIPEPGKVDLDEIEKTWRRHCELHNVAVLVPQSASEKSWSPDEISFVVSAVDNLGKRVKYDSNRVVVGGMKTGGAMASLIAFGQRDLFRGLALINSTVSKRAAKPVTSPVEPMLVLIGSNGELNEKQQAAGKLLENAHIPWAAEVKPEGASFDLWAGDLMKWTRAVNRF